jgi:pimeloyl-ACP methyl ester carboxylesterase
MATDFVVGQHRIHLDDRGQGTPVVLLHSSGLSHQQWRRLRELLEPRHRVLSPDFISYGGSSRWEGPGDFHYREDVAVVQALVRSAGAPVHLVGHSYGGFIALVAAATADLPLASISVFDPVAFGALSSTQDREGLANLEAASSDPQFLDPALAGTATWAEKFVNFWSGDGYWARLPEPQRQAFLSSGPKMFYEVRSLVLDRPPLETYQRITVPTLFLTGSASPAAGRRTAAILATALPHGGLVEIPGAGHMGPLTHAAAVNSAIDAHIAEVDSR